MSTTFTRTTSVQVTNIAAANTGGGTAQSAAIGDVILFDRQFNQVADTATVQTSAEVETLYVGLGVGGASELSMPIQVRNIRNVVVTPFVAASPYTVTVGGIVPLNSTEYVVKIIYRDQFSSAPAHSAPRSYSFISDATATALEIATGLAARINADKLSQVIASVAADTLVIAGKVIPANAIDYYQRVSFDIATPLGFSLTATTLTVAPGSDGRGIGQKVKDLEQSTKFIQRVLHPIPTETTKADLGGRYNLVNIEHYNEHIGDMANQRKEPLKTVIAFAVGVNATTQAIEISAKQAAFMVKLASVVESAGTFVS